jgi:hypothetical protein
MGGFKKIATDIEEIIRNVYMFSDFSTEKTFTEMVYKRCYEDRIPSKYMYYTDKKIKEALNV